MHFNVSLFDTRYVCPEVNRVSACAKSITTILPFYFVVDPVRIKIKYEIPLYIGSLPTVWSSDVQELTT